jgi:hypothetical protein
MSTGYGRKSKITEKILDNRREVTVYRKEFNKLTGDAKASLLLNQFIYWDKVQGGGEFYKYIAPPKDPTPQYRKGDSWTEEMGFTRREFDTAIKKIGYKRGKTKKNKFDNEEDAYIIYYTAYNLTHWFINWDKLNRDLIDLYYAEAYSFAENLFGDDTRNKGDKNLFNIMLITKGITKCNLLKELLNVNYYYSEITTENTTEKKHMYKGKVDNDKDKKPANKDKQPLWKREEVVKVWNYYERLFDYDAGKLTNKYRGKIADRLKTFTVDEIKHSLEAMSQNSWITGDNDKERFYATPAYCFRSDDKIKEWLKNYEVSQENKIDYYADLRDNK